MLILFLIFQDQLNLQILKGTDNNQGSTLLELLLTLSIISIIIMCFYFILTFTNNAYVYGNMEDEVLLNGRYAMEYIKRDIKSADKIIAINKIDGLDEKFKDNIGFIVMKYSPDIKDKYKYSTYYLKDNKLRRIANNREINKYPPSRGFDGHNLIAEYVISIDDTHIDWEKKLIKLSLNLGDINGEKIKLETKLKIRCPIDY